MDRYPGMKVMRGVLFGSALLAAACVGRSAMDHGAMDHGAMDHSAMDHSAMDHSTMDHSTMDHNQHAAGSSTPTTSTVDIRNVQPSATLRPDSFDAPSPISVNEAARAAQSGGHAGHTTTASPPVHDHHGGH